MSVDDPERPRKTLTLTKRPGAATPTQDAGKRKRGGARARLVAQNEKQRAKDQPDEPVSPRHARAADDTGSTAGNAPRSPRRPAVTGKPQYSERRPQGTDEPRLPARRTSETDEPRRPVRRASETDVPRRPVRLASETDVPRRPARRASETDEPQRPVRRASETDGRRLPARRQYESSDGASRPARHAPRTGDPGAATLPPAESPDENYREIDVRFVERDDRHERPRKHARDIGERAQERFHVFAPCPQGLEEALEIEMRALGFDDARSGRAGVHFSADWTGVQHANLYSRLAARILVQVAQAPVQEENDLLDLAYATPWERWFGAERTLRVDTSAIKSPMRSLQYCNLRVKDGICDRLMDREGARPDIDTVRPDARVHVFLTADTATLYLDTSGESLFKRGWRLDKGEAPLRENLAAGMLALAGWDPSAPLLDPFCGSGTILIEAAWIALGVPPGIAHPFSFERLRDHDARRWQDLKDDARAHIQPRLETPLFGYDIDPAAIEHARRNAERAWLTEDAIEFQVGDARTLEAPADRGWIVTNPPYGERLQAGHDESLWRDWAACLKRQFAGWQVHAISSDMTLPQQMRLKPMRRIPLHNGPLDCRLFGFELVSSSYRDKHPEPEADA